MIPPAPTTPAPMPNRLRPPCGPAACPCPRCGHVRARAQERVDALLTAVAEARADERQRIINMISRFASMDEDAGMMAEAEVQHSLIRAIEELRHVGHDGEPFVAVELEQ